MIEAEIAGITDRRREEGEEDTRTKGGAAEEGTVTTIGTTGIVTMAEEEEAVIEDQGEEEGIQEGEDGTGIKAQRGNMMTGVGEENIQSTQDIQVETDKERERICVLAMNQVFFVQLISSELYPADL